MTFPTSPEVAPDAHARLLTAAAQMLVHVGLPEHAERVKNAWLCTLEDGVHTGDVFREGLSRQRVGTRAFAAAVIERLGRNPQQLEPVKYAGGGIRVHVRPTAPVRKELVGVDVFLDWAEAGGPAVLIDRPGRGRRGPVDAGRGEELKARLRAGPTAADRVCTLRGEDVRILADEFGVVRSLAATYELLHRLGFEPLRPRPRHPKAADEEQEAFK